MAEPQRRIHANVKIDMQFGAVLFPVLDPSLWTFKIVSLGFSVTCVKMKASMPKMNRENMHYNIVLSSGGANVFLEVVEITELIETLSFREKQTSKPYS